MGYQISYDANLGAVPFDPSTYSGLDIITSAWAITGSRAFRLRTNRTWAYLQTDFQTPVATPAISFWVYHIRIEEDAYVRFYTTSGHHISAVWDTTNFTWDLYVGANKVADGTAGVAPSARFYNFRMYGTLADSGGSLTVKVDGIQIVTFSGDTLPDGSDTTVEYVEYGFYVSHVLNADAAYISSISLNDGGTDPSDRRCYVCMVDGDSAVQWTPSTGSDNYAVLDDVPPSAGYVETATNGHVDKLTLETVTDIETIYGVIKALRAAKTTAAAEQVKNGVDSNGTLDSTTHDLTTSQKYYFHPMENNPDDAAAWEVADIDALLTYREAIIP